MSVKKIFKSFKIWKIFASKLDHKLQYIYFYNYSQDTHGIHKLKNLANCYSQMITNNDVWLKKKYK
mgnify:CR=1 FL=1